MLTIVGSNSASGLASTPAKYVLGDERDRWALSAGTEGDPWSLAEARTTTFYNSKMVDVSTPTDKETSPIAKSFMEGTRERWCHQCPHCGEYVNIVFDDIKFEFDTIGTGRKKDYVVTSISWCCPECGCISSEDEMRKQPAKWIPENPDAYKKGHRSFWLNAFSSPWQPWEKVVYAFLVARKDPQQLKVVYNTMLGELWEDRGDLADEETMLSRREDYGTREDGTPVELPKGVLVLTCGVDTQDDRLEYEVVGHGHYGETWGIKKGIIMGDPGYNEPWERLDEVVSHVYRFADGTGLSISMTFVDSGGHKTQQVYTQCRARLQRRVFAIKGQGGDGIPYTKPPSKVKIVVNGQAIGQTWLYSIGVDAGKADIMGALKVQEPGPKYCHFPKGMERGYDNAFFNGLLSEKLVMKTDRGRTRWAWEKLKGHERNEALDCRNYALAALRVLDPDMDKVEARLRQKADEKPKAQAPAQRARKRAATNRHVADSNDW
jgi:phage terminase large subunit GpA-like protein